MYKVHTLENPLPGLKAVYWCVCVHKTVQALLLQHREGLNGQILYRKLITLNSFIA